MKILIITTNLNTKNGWGRYSRDFIEGIFPGNDILVVVSEKVSNLNIEQVEILEDQFRYMANPIRSYIASRKIQKVINSFNPDIIHFFIEPYATILPFLKTKKGVKTFLTVHGTYCFIPAVYSEDRVRYFISKFFTKIVYRKLTNIVSVSSYIKDYMLDKYRATYKEEFDANKIKVITNGINLNVFSKEQNNSTPLKEKKSIVFVGQVYRRKGILETIEALGIYSKKYGNNFIYTIVGPHKENSEYIKLLKEKIRNYGLEESVVWYGLANDEQLKLIYGNADLYIMLSIHDRGQFEGFGLVYLEASAFGVPSLGSSTSGANEAIKDQVSGYIVDPFNPEEISEKINSIINLKTIKSEDCIGWAEANSIKDKSKILLDLYKK